MAARSESRQEPAGAADRQIGLRLSQGDEAALAQVYDQFCGLVFGDGMARTVRQRPPGHCKVAYRLVPEPGRAI